MWNKMTKRGGKGGSGMGNGRRDWAWMYMTYGVDEWHTSVFLLLHALAFSLLSLLLLVYFAPAAAALASLPAFSLLPSGSPRFAAGLIGSLTALTALSLLFAAAHFLYSAVPLRWEVSQRIISAVGDWSGVKTALDVGCGRGILLNAVALQLKKQGSSGRVVGLDERRSITMETLRTAGMEGVQEYVTCREGDARRMPFRDDYFDVVVSGAAIRRAGRRREERERVVGEVVRVLKPGGVGVVWDLQHVPEYVRKLHELRMEDIRVSERVTAYMTTSHIVSFRKPFNNFNNTKFNINIINNNNSNSNDQGQEQQQHVLGPVYAYAGEVRLDWRCHNLC